MTTWAISVVRDEADIIGSTLKRMQGEVDHILVADHGSVDGTREIAEEYAEVIDAGEWEYQAPTLNKLVDRAIEAGVEWVVPFDADERWVSPWGPISETLSGMPQGIALALWYDHLPTTEDGSSGDPLVDMPWRRQRPNGMMKVACRTQVPLRLGEGQHHAIYPAPEALALEVRHFPYRSPEQMERKVTNGLSAVGMSGRDLASVPHFVELERRIKAVGREEAFAEILVEKPGRNGLVKDLCP